jgi:hypothetical protein
MDCFESRNKAESLSFFDQTFRWKIDCLEPGRQNQRKFMAKTTDVSILKAEILSRILKYGAINGGSHGAVV